MYSQIPSLLYLYFQELESIIVHPTIGYVCSEIRKKSAFVKDKEPSQVSLGNLHTEHHLDLSSGVFGNCIEAEILSHSVQEGNNGDDIIIEYTLLSQDFPSVYSDKLSYVCYDFESEGSLYPILEPITILDYNDTIFSSLSGRSIASTAHVIKEKLRKITSKYRDLDRMAISYLIDRVSEGIDLKNLKVKFFSTTEEASVVIVNFLYRIQAKMNRVDLVYKTYEDLFDLYISKTKSDQKTPRDIKEEINGYTQESIIHNRNLYNIIIEFGKILIYLMAICEFKIKGNIYDPSNIIPDNRIKCSKCLVLMIELDKEEVKTISIVFMTSNLKVIKFYVTNMAPKKIVSIPLKELSPNVKYLGLILNQGKLSDHIINLEKDVFIPAIETSDVLSK